MKIFDIGTLFSGNYDYSLTKPSRKTNIKLGNLSILEK